MVVCPASARFFFFFRFFFFSSVSWCCFRLPMRTAVPWCGGQRGKTTTRRSVKKQTNKKNQQSNKIRDVNTLCAFCVCVRQLPH
ncbi:hypothetical protein TRSC58_07506 [Trypanosoma rangeli SC58]|uniref:Uncharacterized protein n=1 Tax=Trypanosoma rangeli SC58 TaxID=429131 RepID=A0A061IRL0_TRYRA|nr:hypothetical protein TRSC58_07506 [Trypanosoma rangeli SC58]